jgi:hypothetical protein
VSPSTLVSAYRATTHFTPRDGVAEPYMATAGRGVARPLSVDTPDWRANIPRSFAGCQAENDAMTS